MCHGGGISDLARSGERDRARRPIPPVPAGYSLALTVMVSGWVAAVSPGPLAVTWAL